ncbi:MAG: succinylglutamate desuccinylase/aspartoacylase family protein [Paracoccaceae bacterium]
MAKRENFQIAGRSIPPGRRATVALPMTNMPDHTPVALSVHVVHGSRPGPTMFVSAAIHGDEVIGVEIVRRLLRHPSLNGIAGTLLAVPIVNAFGFLSNSRYLPDRRDLNRCFPGSASGSLASRLAYTFRTEVMARATYGIDLHSAAIHRTNLPQIRVSPGQPEALRLARAFAAPVTLTSRMRDGSLRATASAAGVTVLLFEGGEGLRVDEAAVRIAVAGILRVMVAVGMLPASAAPRAKAATVHCQKSDWLRAPGAGLMTLLADVGDRVKAGAVLATISDPFGETEVELVATKPGILLGRAHLPLVNEGDALFHLAELPEAEEAADQVMDIPDEDELI